MIIFALILCWNWLKVYSNISENDAFLHHLTNTYDLVDGFRNETVWPQKIINIMLLNLYDILLMINCEV